MYRHLMNCVTTCANDKVVGDVLGSCDCELADSPSAAAVIEDDNA